MGLQKEKSNKKSDTPEQWKSLKSKSTFNNSTDVYFFNEKKFGGKRGKEKKSWHSFANEPVKFSERE